MGRVMGYPGWVMGQSVFASSKKKIRFGSDFFRIESCQKILTILPCLVLNLDQNVLSNQAPYPQNECLKKEKLPHHH